MMKKFKIINSAILMLLIVLVTVSVATGQNLRDRFSKEDIKRRGEMKSVRMTGTIELAGLPGDVKLLYKAPSFIRISTDLGGFRMVQGYNGNVAWLMDQNDQVMEIFGSSKRQLINAAWLTGDSFLFDDRVPGEARFVADTIIGKTKYEVYGGLPDEGDSIWLYFNPMTSRIEKVQERLDEIPVLTTYSDFRMINGVPMPFRQEAVSPVPQLNSTVTISDIEIDPDVENSQFAMPELKTIDYSFPDGADSVMVAMQYINGHIYLAAEVNDQDSAYFILDSGSGINALDKNYADRIGLEYEGNFPAKGISGYGSAGVAKADSLSIGGIRLYNQTLSIVDLSSLGLTTPSQSAFGGILGYDLLSRFPIRLDFQGKKLIFYNPDSFVPPSDEYRVDFEFLMKVPVCRAMLDGYEGRFLVDLGNPVGLMLHEQFVERHELKKRFSNVREMQSKFGGIGGDSEAWAAITDNFIFGPAKMDSIAVIIAGGEQGIVKSDEVDGNIGNMILEQFSVTFDYAHKRLYIMPLN